MRGKKGYYYPRTLSAMINTVMNMFSDVIVYNYDNNSDITGPVVKVELGFAGQKKMSRARTNEDQLNFSTTYPRINVIYNLSLIHI